MYSAPQTFLNSLSQSVPAFLLTAWFGAPIAGAYWLAARVLVMPSNLVGFAFRQVYYEHACRLHRGGTSLYPVLRSATLALSVGGCGLIVMAVLLAPRAFTLVFGATWLLAGQYAAILAPWLAAGFSNLPSVSILPILGRQRFGLILDSATLLIRVGAIGCGALLSSHFIAVGLYSGVGMAMNILLIAAVFAFARQGSRTGAIGQMVASDPSVPRYA